MNVSISIHKQYFPSLPPKNFTLGLHWEPSIVLSDLSDALDVI